MTAETTHVALGALVDADGQRASDGVVFRHFWSAEDFDVLFERAVALAVALSPVTRVTEKRFCAAQAVLRDDVWVRVEHETLRTEAWTAFDVAEARHCEVVTSKPDVVRRAEVVARRVTNPYQDGASAAALCDALRKVASRRMRLRVAPRVEVEFRVVEWTLLQLVNANGLGLERTWIDGPTTHEVVVHCPCGRARRRVADVIKVLDEALVKS